MSTQANPAIVGGFAVGAVALAIAGILIFGSGQFFTPAYPYVLYFEGDVSGLQVGAPVKFQGVQVGTVTGITAMFHPTNYAIRLPVQIELQQGSMKPSLSAQGAQTAVLPGVEEGIKALVSRGLRAQLQMESMVTGLLFVQFSLLPEESSEEVRLDPGTGLPEIPTIPTTMQEVRQTVQKALDKISKLPLEQIVTSLLTTLQHVDGLVQHVDGVVSGPEVTKTVATFNDTLLVMKHMLEGVDGQIDELVASVRTTLTDVQNMTRDDSKKVVRVAAELSETLATMRATFESVRQTVVTVEESIIPGSPLRYDLANSLKELSAAARSLRVLANYLERHPNAVLFGKGKSGGQ